MRVSFKIFEAVPLEPSGVIDYLMLFVTVFVILYILGNALFVIWRRHDMLIVTHGRTFLIAMCVGSLIHLISHFISDAHLDVEPFVWLRTFHCTLWDFWGEYMFGFAVWYTALFLRVVTWYIAMKTSGRGFDIGRSKASLQFFRIIMVMSIATGMFIVCLIVEIDGGTYYDQALGYCAAQLYAKVAIVGWMCLCCCMLWGTLLLLYFRNVMIDRLSTYIEIRDVIVASTIALVILTFINVSGWSSYRIGRMFDTLTLETLYVFSLTRIMYQPVKRWIRGPKVLNFPYNLPDYGQHNTVEPRETRSNDTLEAFVNRCSFHDIFINPDAWHLFTMHVSGMPSVRAPARFNETMEPFHMNHLFARMFSWDKLKTNFVIDDEEADNVDEIHGTLVMDSNQELVGCMIVPKKIVALYMHIQGYKKLIREDKMKHATTLRGDMIQRDFGQYESAVRDMHQWTAIGVFPELPKSINDLSSSEASNPLGGMQDDMIDVSLSINDNDGTDYDNDNRHAAHNEDTSSNVIQEQYEWMGSRWKWLKPLFPLIRLLRSLTNIVFLREDDDHTIPISQEGLTILCLAETETEDVQQTITSIERNILFVLEFVYFPQMREDKEFMGSLQRCMNTTR
jgi:hypothetical protein